VRPLFIATRIALTAIFLATSIASGIAQGTISLKDQLVGVWGFVSSGSRRDDGSNTWGPNAKGQLMFTSDGRFSYQLMRSDRPKYKSGTRMRGSIIENQATTRGTLSYFGTYAVSEPDSILVFNIESSSFPNVNGTIQKRIIKVVGDELHYLNPSPSRGTTAATQVWKRLK
jgi:hypothetical protein